jgi:hypothetical protein
MTATPDALRSRTHPVTGKDTVMPITISSDRPWDRPWDRPYDVPNRERRPDGSPVVRVGDRSYSLTMQPLGANGWPINHGMSWANADTLTDAYAYARRVLTAGEVAGFAVVAVDITGQLTEFTGASWSPVNDRPAMDIHEVVTREARGDHPMAVSANSPGEPS